MPSNVVNLHLPSGGRDNLAETPVEPPGTAAASLDGRRQQQGANRTMSLHVSKLRGISNPIRNKLKVHGVTYTHQLLEAAGPSEARSALARRSGIEEAILLRLACRADLARIKGVGAIFADMLELIGVDRVSRLAGYDPAKLHAVLYDLNTAERLARRAPTPDEVADWVAQARVLPQVVEPQP